ncbi:hypothetical protein V1511DRAFT_504108 [Dipodascopsis uninucleata]
MRLLLFMWLLLSFNFALALDVSHMINSAVVITFDYISKPCGSTEDAFHYRQCVERASLYSASVGTIPFDYNFPETPLLQRVHKITETGTNMVALNWNHDIFRTIESVPEKTVVSESADKTELVTVLLADHYAYDNNIQHYQAENFSISGELLKVRYPRQYFFCNTVFRSVPFNNTAGYCGVYEVRGSRRGECLPDIDPEVEDIFNRMPLQINYNRCITKFDGSNVKFLIFYGQQNIGKITCVTVDGWGAYGKDTEFTYIIYEWNTLILKYVKSTARTSLITTMYICIAIGIWQLLL